MEPGVMDSLRTYVASGGKPAAAIELLSENYRGYAQMSSLACRWLELTEPACGDPAPKKAAASASRGAADLGREPGAAGFSAAVSPVAQFNVRGGDASAVATPRDYGDELDTPTGGFTASRVFGDANATPPPASVSASAVAAADAAAAAAARGLARRRGRTRRTSWRSSSGARSTRGRWTRSRAAPRGYRGSWTPTAGAASSSPSPRSTRIAFSSPSPSSTRGSTAGRTRSGPWAPPPRRTSASSTNSWRTISGT